MLENKNDIAEKDRTKFQKYKYIKTKKYIVTKIYYLLVDFDLLNLLVMNLSLALSTLRCPKSSIFPLSIILRLTDTKQVLKKI